MKVQWTFLESHYDVVSYEKSPAEWYQSIVSGAKSKLEQSLKDFATAVTNEADEVKDLVCDPAFEITWQTGKNSKPTTLAVGHLVSETLNLTPLVTDIQWPRWLKIAMPQKT